MRDTDTEGESEHNTQYGQHSHICVNKLFANRIEGDSRPGRGLSCPGYPGRGRGAIRCRSPSSQSRCSAGGRCSTGRPPPGTASFPPRRPAAPRGASCWTGAGAAPLGNWMSEICTQPPPAPVSNQISEHGGRGPFLGGGVRIFRPCH